jgi:predicted nuclease with TOPRIM domain
MIKNDRIKQLEAENATLYAGSLALFDERCKLKARVKDLETMLEAQYILTKYAEIATENMERRALAAEIAKNAGRPADPGKDAALAQQSTFDGEMRTENAKLRDELLRQKETTEEWIASNQASRHFCDEETQKRKNLEAENARLSASLQASANMRYSLANRLAYAAKMVDALTLTVERLEQRTKDAESKTMVTP